LIKATIGIINKLMFRAIPCPSKIIGRKDLEEKQKKHQQTLQAIRKSNSEYFNMNPKHKLKEKPSLHRNNRFLKEKAQEIKENNRKLAEKIECIANPAPPVVFIVVKYNIDKVSVTKTSVKQCNGED